MRSLLLASAFVLIAPRAFAAEAAGGWKPISDEEGIKVWQREVPGTSFVEFRGQGDVKTNMKQILAVLHDNTRKTEWMNRCRENRLVRARKVGNNIIYSRVGSGFPLIDDRDVVVESHLTILLEQKKVRIDVKNVADPLAPEVDGVVRMPRLVLSWTLEWKDAHTTGVTYQVQADPGSVSGGLDHDRTTGTGLKLFDALDEIVG